MNFLALLRFGVSHKGERNTRENKNTLFVGLSIDLRYSQDEIRISLA